MARKFTFSIAAALTTALIAAGLHGKERSEPQTAATTTMAGTVAGPRSTLDVGEATRKTRGDLAVYVPAELSVRGAAFDLVIHFHGTSKNQETNIEEARLPAAVVSVNEGGLSDVYAKAFAGSGSLDRVVRFAEEVVGAKRVAGARAERIALSSWSAGGAAVKNILAREPERIDAVIVADGLFSSWEDEAKTSVRREPLRPFVDFARKAAAGEKLFVVTHTAIPTEYPNVEECTRTLLDELEIEPGPPAPATQPAGGEPTYAVDRGSFHVRGVDGKGAEDHIAQIRALDDPYAELRRRWQR